MTRPRPHPGPSDGAEIYPVDQPVPKGPALPGKVAAAPTTDDLLDLVAADLVAQALICVRRFGDFQLAVCGGSIPQLLYERLMYAPDFRALPWTRTHLWSVHDQCVAPDDQRSNYRMIRETLVEHSGIPPEQAHPMAAVSSTADRDYEAQLHGVLEWRERGEDRLDYVLLEMGADGRIAGLFPHTEPLGETRRLVRFNACPGPPASECITMTLRLINAARFIAVLVIGRSNAATIQRVASGNDPVEELPVKGLSPINGELKWYLDGEACGEASHDQDRQRHRPS